MTNTEAIARIQDHMIIHKINEERAVRLTEALNMAIDALKKNYGEWIWGGDCFICSKCGAAYSWWTDSQVSNYCPNCEKKMKKI